MYNNEMPIPTRSAPRPPGNYGARSNDAWSNNDLYGSTSTMQPVQKKKPPPRPPPPRFKKDYTGKPEERTKKPARPSELLTNFFGRKPQQRSDNVNPAFPGYRSSNQGSQSGNLIDGSVSLIDLSPPGSPTFTTRSSSDGVSVDSFGSDGNSNPSIFTSSGNTSQTESAFEDDFDFFGSLNSGTSMANDPWKIGGSNDPFSPSPSSNGNNTSNTTKRIGDARFFAYNDIAATSRTVFDPPAPSVSHTMPTIIRARPPKPPAPKILHRSLAPTVTDFSVGASSSSSLKINVPSSGSTAVRFGGDNEWPATFDENPSPPMPSIPPPAPPSEYLADVDVATAKQTVQRPHGIALYDFAASQNGDLSLKQGDCVELVRVVNDEWLEGRVGNRSGIFPANFVDVVVPLSDSSNNIVKALYSFAGETWEDLSFEEGAKITVLSRISDDWLYGECRGKKGQFPANYVDRVPHGLPKYS